MRLPTDHIRHSLRTLARHKRFSALAILSLAIAIALNTTMYSVLDALIYPKLAMKDQSRLYEIHYLGDYKGRVSKEEKMQTILAMKSFAGITRDIPTFGFGSAPVVERSDKSSSARVRTVSPNYFEVLGN